MRLADFDYDLPKSFIAQDPATPRDSSKLLIYDTANDRVIHSVFRDIVSYLSEDDVLVVNRSKVIPARMKFVIGGKEVEVFRLDNGKNDIYKCLVRPGRVFRDGFVFDVNKKLSGCVVCVNEDGTRDIKFSGGDVLREIEKVGEPPFPPYITSTKARFERYQTVYSVEKGSVASPTAGLHFTEGLLGKIKDKGVSIRTVLLHVGLGTFLPVKTDRIEDHVMHSEFYEIDGSTSAFLNKAKKDGERIVAVGTTSVRVLENSFKKGAFVSACEETDIFIYPGYKWKVVDALVTNFHLPKSTLLMLVASFLEHKGVKNGTKKILELYKIAKKNGYRFYSFGDAMFIF